MKTSKYSESQIATALRQVEAGAPIAEVTRSLGVSEATYYHWRKKYGQRWRSRRAGGSGSWRRRTGSSSNWWRISRWIK